MGGGEDGWMDRWVDGRVDGGWVGGRVDGWSLSLPRFLRATLSLHHSFKGNFVSTSHLILRADPQFR